MRVNDILSSYICYLLTSLIAFEKYSNRITLSPLHWIKFDNTDRGAGSNSTDRGAGSNLVGKFFYFCSFA